IKREIAVGADMEDTTRAGADQFARHVAGGDDAVPCIIRHAERSDLFAHVRTGARGIGDEDNGNAGLSRALKGFDRARESRHAVMDNTPYVAENGRIVPGDTVQTVDQIRHEPFTLLSKPALSLGVRELAQAEGSVTRFHFFTGA